MSASLKDNGTNGNGDDGVDYNDPALNGGRSRGPHVVHSNAHFVVNFGVIIMIACVVGLLLLCMGCGPIKTDHKGRTRGANTTQCGAQLVPGTLSHEDCRRKLS